MAPPPAKLAGQTPTYEGQACRVRPFTPQDAPAFYDFARRDDVSWFMNWPPHASVAETQRRIDTWCASQDHDIETPWAIASRDSNTCCGFVGFSKVSQDHLHADLAVALHPDFGGRGMATEACRLLLQHAKKIGLIRVQAVVEEGNAASRKLMVRLGGHEEGLMRHYLVAKSGIVHAYLYGFYLV